MPRVRWAVHCRGTSIGTGAPCEAYAVRGGTVCANHGGNTRQVRAAALARLVAAVLERSGGAPPSAGKTKAWLANPH